MNRKCWLYLKNLCNYSFVFHCAIFNAHWNYKFYNSFTFIKWFCCKSKYPISYWRAERLQYVRYYNELPVWYCSKRVYLLLCELVKNINDTSDKLNIDSYFWNIQKKTLRMINTRDGRMNCKMLTLFPSISSCWIILYRCIERLADAVRDALLLKLVWA